MDIYSEIVRYTKIGFTFILDDTFWPIYVTSDFGNLVYSGDNIEHAFLAIEACLESIADDSKE